MVAALTIATLVAVVVRLAITFAENRRLLDQLQHDPLTGLGNRSKLFIDLPPRRSRTGASRTCSRSSTSTASRPTTTPSATPPATRC